LPIAHFYVGDDAAKHLCHYFPCSGSAYTIDLEGMVRDVADAAAQYEDEVRLAKQFVEQLRPGRHDIVAQSTTEGYNEEEKNRNWYYALGGYHSWGRGVVHRQGLGREFDCVGCLRRQFAWNGGSQMSRDQMHTTIGRT